MRSLHKSPASAFRLSVETNTEIPHHLATDAIGARSLQTKQRPGRWHGAEAIHENIKLISRLAPHQAVKLLSILIYKSSMAQHGGKRPRAGRPKEAKNKRTIERQHRHMQIVARKAGKEAEPLGKQVMEYFMGIALRYAKAYELTDADLSFDSNPDVKEVRDWKRHQFQVWAKLAMTWAADLAPYQSPTFRAISISHQKDESEDKGTTVLHTMDQVRAMMLSRGVSPEQFGRALMGPPPMIDHDDHGEKKR